jgi:hypothetical protein
MMAESTLIQVQHLVDELSPLEQVRLLEYLTPRIAQAISSRQAAQDGGEAGAWEEFFRLGEALAAEDRPGQETLTAAVLGMRR